MEDKKKWYLSKTVISCVVTALIGAYMTIDSQAATTGLNLPDIPEFVLVVLAAIGVYGRVTAKTEITK